MVFFILSLFSVISIIFGIISTLFLTCQLFFVIWLHLFHLEIRILPTSLFTVIYIFSIFFTYKKLLFFLSKFDHENINFYLLFSICLPNLLSLFTFGLGIFAIQTEGMLGWMAAYTAVFALTPLPPFIIDAFFFTCCHPYILVFYLTFSTSITFFLFLSNRY
jgi:hypothetical protein